MHLTPRLARSPQVFYHLDDLDDALTYALGAGKLFDVNDSSEYVQTILGACDRCSAAWADLRPMLPLSHRLKRCHSLRTGAETSSSCIPP